MNVPSHDDSDREPHECTEGWGVQGPRPDCSRSPKRCRCCGRSQAEHCVHECDSKLRAR